MGGEEAVTWEEAVNMGVNMGGGCGVCPPPPLAIIQLIRGGGTPQNLMGGLTWEQGEHGGSLKCCQKITVKEFDSKVAGYYKPASLQIY